MKKAFLSIAAILALVTINGCKKDSSSLLPSSSSDITSSEVTSSSEESSSISSSSSSSTSSSSATSSEESSEDVVTYSLSVTGPEKTEYETGDVFEFANCTIKLFTITNSVSDDGVILSRNQYTVIVNGQPVEGDLTLSNEGTVTITFKANDHEEATGSLTLSVVTYYNLTNASSEYVVLRDLPSRAKANEVIHFTLTLLPGYYFDGVITITDTNGNPVDFTVNENYFYTFTMPASNIVISTETGLNNFTITRDNEIIEKIILDDDSGEEVDIFSATPGTKLKFKAENSVDYSFTEVYIDGNACAKGDDEYYHFIMPHHPVHITTDKVARVYPITGNFDSLTLSTTTIYKDPDTKEPITRAIKGDVVYMHFDYSVTLVKYTVSVKDADGSTLIVTKVEGEDTYYFTMVSSDITVEVTEEDYSLYYGYYVTEKVFKTYNLYGSGNKLEEKDYSSLSSIELEFFSNGSYRRNSSSSTWEIDQDGTSGHIVAASNDFYYTPHLIVSRFDNGDSGTWDDASVGTWDENTVIHAMKFDSKNRIIWVEDAERNITENILITADNVYLGVTLTKEDGSTCLGSDITTESTFFATYGDNLTMEVRACLVVQSFNITAESTAEYSLAVKDAEGNAITTAKNSETVYVYGSLLEENTAKYISAISVLNGSTKVVTTALEDVENAWSFVMPKGDVTITLTIVDPNKYAGYEAVGKYVGYNIWSSKSGDLDFSLSSAPGIQSWEVTAGGKMFMNSASSDIVSMENSNHTTIVASRTYTYGNDVIATPYSSSITDSYVGVRLPDGVEKTTLKVKTHWMGSASSFAVEFYFGETLAGGLFATNGTYYCGVTFTYEEGTERIGNTGTYHVVLDGETIFDVANGVISAHASE